ncbi:MAG TPA: hypothetical protein VGB53_01210, partial [Rubricoccaceae bacterium]
MPFYSARLGRTRSAIALGAALVVTLTAITASASGGLPEILTARPAAERAAVAAAPARPVQTTSVPAVVSAEVSVEAADSLSAEVVTEPSVAAVDGPTTPYAPILAPSVTATLTAVLADPADTEVNPGDVLRYIATITNAGADAALGLAYTGTLDANTTLVPGSVRVSPLASSDAYPGAYAGIAFGVNAAAGLLANDSGGIPAATVASFGGGAVGGTAATNAAGTTATFGAGGSLTVNADGSYSLTAP